MGSTREILLALLLVLLAGAVTAALARPPRPLGPDAPREHFSAARAAATLAELLGPARPRPAGSAEHARVRARLEERLRALGLEVELQEALAEGPDGKVALCRNVLARLPGRSPGLAVALFAHYDSVGAGPGAADDGAGVACLPEIARALAPSPLERDLLFVFTDAEEVGLVGASAFLERPGHPWARTIGVALSLEARGTTGPSLMFESSPDGAWLIEALARASSRPRTTSLAELVYKTLPNDTDFSVLRAVGIPGLNFAFIGGLARYHTPRDELAELDPRSVQHHGEQALALVRELARAELERVPRGRIAWTDVAGRFLLRWPVSLGPFLALAALLLATCALLRAREGARGLARAAGASIAGSALGLLAGTLLMAGTQAASGLPDPAVAQPWPARLALVLAVLAGVVAAGGPLAARAGARAVLLAQALLGALAALVVSLELPEVLPLFLPPAAAAGAGALLAARGGPWRLRIGWALPLVCAVVLAQPLYEALEDSFGYALPLVPATLAAVPATLCLPALASSAPRALLRLAAAAAMLALGAATLALVVRAHDARSPAWLNVRFVQDETRRTARWDVSTFGLEPPAELRALGLEPAREPPFSWLSFDRSLWVAQAARWEVAPPSLELLEELPGAAGRELRLRVSSPRGATRLHLHVPPGTQLVAARRGEQELELLHGRSRSTIFCAIPPEEGLELLLEVGPRAASPLELWLLDLDWSLPPEAARWLAARPPERVPRADGDVSILGRRFELP